MSRGQLLNWGSWLRVAEHVDELLCCVVRGCLGRGEGWHLTMVGEEIGCACDALAFCLGYMEFVTAVMLECWPKIPRLFSMWCPTLPCLWVFKDKRAASGWGKGGAVEIELSVDLRIR